MPNIPSPEQMIAAGPSPNLPSSTAGMSDTIPVKLDETSSASANDTVADKLPVDIYSDADDVPVNPAAFTNPTLLTEPKVDEKAKSDKGDNKVDAEADETVDEGSSTLPLTAVVDTKAEESEATEAGSKETEEIDQITSQWQNYKKKMSKDAGEWVDARLRDLSATSKKIKEYEAKLKESETGRLPDGWYEHPEAYQLMPDYKQGRQYADHLNQVYSFYQQQLVNIREGDEWQDLVQDKDGNITIGKPQKPDAKAQLMIEERLSNARQALSNQTRYLTAYEENFKQHGINSRSKMAAIEDGYFPQYKDSKKLESNPHYQTVQKTMAEHGLSNDRLAGMITKMYVRLAEALEENTKLKGSNNKTSTLKQMQKKAGPNGTLINNGGNVSQVSDPDDIPFDAKKFKELHYRG